MALGRSPTQRPLRCRHFDSGTLSWFQANHRADSQSRACLPGDHQKRLDEFKGTNTAQLTREELQSIEASHPVDSTVVHPKMIESMDPPAFTKNILKRTLQIENGAQLDQLIHTMEEKAQVIEQKLLKYESKDSDINGEEEQK